MGQRNGQTTQGSRSFKWSRTNRLKALFYSLKSKAKKKGIRFEITYEDVEALMVSHCPVLGIPLFFSDTGQPTDNTPSVDKIIPDKGYVKGNIIVVSMRANVLKRDATVNEMIRLAGYYSSLPSCQSAS